MASLVPIRCGHTWQKCNRLQRKVIFSNFYKENQRIYQQQIAYFRETLQVQGMKDWLEKNYPDIHYDCYKIIISPLVHAQQSSNFFESNGFRELQAHVNYPYPQFWSKEEITEASQAILHTIPVTIFTELNHGYINPVGEKYLNQMVRAVSNRAYWVAPSQGENYYPSASTLIEYLNWGLYDLLVVDYVPVENQEKVIDNIDLTMTKGRGFIQFPVFRRFLVELYRKRQPGQTLSDLYPAIIDWFEKHNPHNRNARN